VEKKLLNEPDMFSKPSRTSVRECNEIASDGKRKKRTISTSRREKDDQELCTPREDCGSLM
jgi:hypothetical protein